MTKPHSSQGLLRRRLGLAAAVCSGVGLACIVIPLVWLYSSIDSLSAQATTSSTRELNIAQAFVTGGTVLFVVAAVLAVGLFALMSTRKTKKSNP